MAAAGEPGGDGSKAIHQRHLEAGIQEVVAAKRVMRQSLFETDGGPAPAGREAAAAVRALTKLGAPHLFTTVALSATALVIALAALAVALVR
jgi:hypothetical protein